MGRVIGIIMGVLGLGMITAGVLLWQPLFEHAYFQGGLAVTSGFLGLLIGGGLLFVVVALIWLRRPKELDPYEGYKVNAPDLDQDLPYDDDDFVD